MMEASEQSEVDQLGPELRAYRRAHRLTQQDMATRLGVTQQTVARWEHGLRPRSDLVPIIQSELESTLPGRQGLADIVAIAGSVPVDEDNRAEMREAFLLGCAAIVKRGDRLSDDLMTAVARYLGVFDEPQ